MDWAETYRVGDTLKLASGSTATVATIELCMHADKRTYDVVLSFRELGVPQMFVPLRLDEERCKTMPKRDLTDEERKFVAEATAGSFMVRYTDAGSPYALGARDTGNLFSMEVEEEPETGNEQEGSCYHLPYMRDGEAGQCYLFVYAG